MVKCSNCGNTIPRKTRYYKGMKGGKYHIACGRNIKNKSYAWTK